MRNTPIYNFSAGPATLPESVLRTAQSEMFDYNGTGFSVMTMSHRSDAFMSILYHAEQDLRQLLAIPDNYKVLFLQGGASAQFNMSVMNLANGFKRVDSVVTGQWSRWANFPTSKSIWPRTAANATSSTTCRRFLHGTSRPIRPSSIL